MKKFFEQWKGFAVGVAATFILGFTFGGWTMESTVKKMVAQAEKNSTTVALARLCVYNFEHQANAADKLAELKKVDSWKRDDFVFKAGFATILDAKEGDRSIAEACAKALADAK